MPLNTHNTTLIVMIIYEHLPCARCFIQRPFNFHNSVSQYYPHFIHKETKRLRRLSYLPTVIQVSVRMRTLVCIIQWYKQSMALLPPKAMAATFYYLTVNLCAATPHIKLWKRLNNAKIIFQYFYRLIYFYFVVYLELFTQSTSMFSEDQVSFIN